jgi:hypothetical protein
MAEVTVTIPAEHVPAFREGVLCEVKSDIVWAQEMQKEADDRLLSILFAEGRNAVQVQRWLGHFSSDYTLKTYVHLLEDGVGDADFLDAVTGRGEHRDEQTTHKQPEPLAA